MNLEDLTPDEFQFMRDLAKRIPVSLDPHTALPDGALAIHLDRAITSAELKIINDLIGKKVIYSKLAYMDSLAGIKLDRIRLMAEGVKLVNDLYYFERL